VFGDFLRAFPYKAIYELRAALPTLHRCPHWRRGAAQNPRSFKKKRIRLGVPLRFLCRGLIGSMTDAADQV
jgi:hypothetical protein